MMPTRWPRPQGARESSARTPSPTCWSMRGRLERVRAAFSTETSRQVVERRAAVDRAAEAVEHPAAQLLADGDRAAGRRSRRHVAPTRRPCGGAERQADDAGGGCWRRPRRAPTPSCAVDLDRSPRAASTPAHQQVQAAQLGDAGRDAAGRGGVAGPRQQDVGRRSAVIASTSGRGRGRRRRRQSIAAVLGLDHGVAGGQRRRRRRRVTGRVGERRRVERGEVRRGAAGPRQRVVDGHGGEHPAHGVGAGVDGDRELAAERAPRRSRGPARRPGRSGRACSARRGLLAARATAAASAARRPRCAATVAAAAPPRPLAPARHGRRCCGPAPRAGPRPSRPRSPGRGRRRGCARRAPRRVASVTASPSTRSSPRRVQTPVAQVVGGVGGGDRVDREVAQHHGLRRRTHRRSPRRTMIWPCSSSWRIDRMIFCWASSTWRQAHRRRAGRSPR